jgi:hypothetical protein
MRAFRSVPLLFVFAVAGCTGNQAPEPSPVAPLPSPTPTPEAGQTAFATLETDYGYYGRYGGGMDTAGAATPGTNSSAPPTAPGGRTGTVEEADIYRVENNRLFYLNTYKGFVIYDLADPAKPKRLSRLPVYGYPIEMFVTKNTVYALVRDSLYLTQDAKGLRFERHNVSQMVAIDITDLANPKVLQTVDIIGELREGVSRKIDDTVYVVSYRPQSYYYRGYPYPGAQTEQAWVYSFNVADPKNLVLVDQLKVFEGGGSNTDTGNGYTSKYFSGVAISATSNTLHVVENWNLYGWTAGGKYQCGTYQSLQQAVVSIIDISDPAGSIKLHTRFETYGQLSDQFKQTYFRDEATGKGYYLGIFGRREWTSSNCSGTSVVQNTLESWDVTDGANPVQLAALAFGKPNETVRGTTFDPTRQLAYAITAQNVDPLYTISYANPSKPTILSAIDGLSGDMSVFRLIGDNQFLIGIGRDGTSTCTGFASPTTGWGTNVAVSIIDVRDPTATRLVQRQCVTVKDAAWVSSQVNWDLDQGHKLIGMNSDGRANVISVPVSFYSKTGPGDWWWYRYQSAVGLMTWDLTRYDPTKNELNQTVLQSWGTVMHPFGEVRRSIIFTHEGATPRRMMVNLSDTHITVTDLEDLSAPVAKSSIEVAPNYATLFKFGNYMVAEVKEGGPYNYQATGSEFQVRPIGGVLEETEPVARFTVGQVSRVIQWKDKLVLVRSVNSGYYSYYQSPVSDVMVYDFADPANPVLAGETKVEGLGLPYYWYSCGDWGWGYWFDTYDTTFAVTDRGLASLGWTYESNGSALKLVSLDLTDATAPKSVTRTLQTRSYSSTQAEAPVTDYLTLVSDPSDPSGLYLTSRDRLSTVEFTNFRGVWYRYFAERWTHGENGLVQDSRTNVPGRLVRSWQHAGERLFLTSDSLYSWVPATTDTSTPYLKPDPRLHLLHQTGAYAELLDSKTLVDYQLSGLIGDADRLYLNLRRSWSYYQTSSAVAYDSQSDELAIFDLSGLKLDNTFMGAIGTYYVQLMGVSGKKLFVSMPGDGVLVVDAANPEQPVGQKFLRTLGWTTHITFAGSTAYVASGNFGIQQLALDEPVAIVSQ